MKKVLLLTFMLFFVSNNIFAQTVSMDETFGESGITMLPNTTGHILRFTYDLSGNIVAYGNNGFETYKYPTIIKTDANGILDQNFGTSGILSLGDIRTEFSDIKVTNENKILFVGGTSQLYIMQFKEDGSFDESFGNNGTIIVNIPGNLVGSVCIENDDFLLVGTWGNMNSISKYNYHGELDENFGENGTVYLDKNTLYEISPLSIHVLGDQSILIAGCTNNYFNAKIALYKLNQAGEVVTDFADNGLFEADLVWDYSSMCDEAILSVLEDNSGNLIITGFTSGSAPAKYFVGKLLSNGTIDGLFGENGYYFYESSDGFYPTNTMQYGGKYLTGCDDKIRCLNKNGTLDTNFHDNGLFVFENHFLHDMKLQGMDKIVLGGSDNGGSYGYCGNYILARLDMATNPLFHTATLSNLMVSDGELDPVFSSNIYNYTVNFVEAEEITITASPTNSNAIVNGTGTFTLEIGENSFAIQVIAEDEVTELCYKIVVNNLLGIAETETSLFKIYPNPTTGELTINSEQLTINTVEIFDVMGRKVHSFGFNVSSSTLQSSESDPEFNSELNFKPETVINISQLHAGIYFVKIKTDTSIKTLKLIKY